MEYRVLGPLEVSSGGSPLDLGAGKPRALLARLVLDVNRAVAIERLVEDLWAEEAPASASKMVQIYVSRLRKSLPDQVLQTRAPGYLLEAAPEAVDVERFTRLRAAGRAALEAGDGKAAAARLHEALALWRGPALAEFAEPFARVEGAHLEELRLACLEDRIEADLALGRHSLVVGELEALAARHRLREPLHRLLILALYRAGRQAEALARYDEFRRRLDDELGIAPSAALQALQRSILLQDPALEPQPAPAAGTPAPAPRPSTGFVGRAAELGSLERALDDATEARGGAVLIAGRAGIGKTRLISELGERARRRGALVLSGRCIQLVGLGLPYLPLVDALRPLRASAPLDGLQFELHELGRLVPGLGRPAAPGAEAAGADARLRLFEEALGLLDHLSASHPLVLVLEDVHWADESTLDLIAFLVHAIRDRRILLVASYRSDAVRPDDHLHALATGLVHSGTATGLTLAPFGRAEIEELVAANGGGPAAEIARRSGGNPLFARELIAAAARGDSALPPALRDVVLAAVARLGAASRSVLRVVAASGRDVPYGLLAAMLPLGEQELAEALREAVELDLLVPDRTRSSFRFRHELLAEAVYATLLPGEREGLHGRLARALAAEPGLATGGAAAAEVAEHWVAAARPVEALEASLRAARDAEAVSGLTEALRHVERVLDLWEQVPGAEQLAGIALPSLLEWAARLAGISEQRDDELHARRLVAVLADGAALDADSLARRLGVGTHAAAATLAVLERDGLIERLPGGAYRSAPLAVGEARRLYPSAVVLESLAVRQSPPYDAAALAELRAANERFRAARDDAPAAVTADDDFHAALTAGCGNDHLVAALRPVKRALLRYERVYMRRPERIDRSAAEHDAIIAALERGDHAEAAQLVRGNLADGIPDLREVLERPA